MRWEIWKLESSKVLCLQFLVIIALLGTLVLVALIQVKETLIPLGTLKLENRILHGLGVLFRKGQISTLNDMFNQIKKNIS